MLPRIYFPLMMQIEKRSKYGYYLTQAELPPFPLIAQKSARLGSRLQWTMCGLCHLSRLLWFCSFNVFTSPKYSTPWCHHVAGDVWDDHAPMTSITRPLHYQ